MNLPDKKLVRVTYKFEDGVGTIGGNRSDKRNRKVNLNF